MIKITVPATSANVGPGFDCLGLALNLYNTYFFEEKESGLLISGCDEKYCNEKNLVYKSYKYVYEKYNIVDKLKGLKIDMKTDIPVCRGLGSSAACIIAGVLAANAISGLNLNTDDILLLATEIEGHPDNIAPALLGNMTAAVMEDNKVYYGVIDIPDELIFCAMIPDFELSTQKSRDVLPKVLDYKDGVFNVARVSLMVTAMANNRIDLLKVSCKDKLHQDYRSKLIANFNDIYNKAVKLDFDGIFLSGAGPTIMGITNDENKADLLNKYTETLPNGWIMKKLKADKTGAIVEEV